MFTYFKLKILTCLLTYVPHVNILLSLSWIIQIELIQILNIKINLQLSCVY
jgi:hypothetical protein